MDKYSYRNEESQIFDCLPVVSVLRRKLDLSTRFSDEQLDEIAKGIFFTWEKAISYRDQLKEKDLDLRKLAEHFINIIRRRNTTIRKMRIKYLELEKAHKSVVYQIKHNIVKTAN